MLFTFPEEKFGKNVLEINFIFQVFFPILSRKIWDFSQKLLERLSNIPSTCPAKSSEGTKTRSKKSLESFSDFGDKVSKFRPKVFSRPFRTEFYASKGWISNNFFLEKLCFFVIPGLQTKKFRFFAESFFQQIYQLCFLRDQKGVLGGYFVWKSVFTNFIHGLQAKMIGFTVEHCREDCQTSNLRVQKFLWRILISEVQINFFFRGLWANTFRTFSENFLAEMHNCLLRVKKRDFWKDKIFFEGRVFLTSISDIQLMVLGLLSKQKSEGSSKLHSTYSEEHFGKKLYKKTQHFLSFSRKISNFWLSAGYSTMDVKISFYVSGRKTFWENRILRKKIIHFLFGNEVGNECFKLLHENCKQSLQNSILRVQ